MSVAVSEGAKCNAVSPAVLILWLILG